MRDYTKKTFRSRFAKEIPVRVFVFDDEIAYNDYFNRRGVDNSGSAGCCWTTKIVKFPEESERSEVHVYLQECYVGAGYVAHEMVHAAMSVRRCVGKRDEETLALLVGDLCFRFWDWYLKKAEEWGE